ncbi:MAG: precorrin-6y C5,15-methyltransferase (decarboxylating) subunit CbiE [Cyanobacteria bacterium]|nr:precorrin-6y C5,15-methyltransferase (decarboxylating) subunit CbiE [Cyanobacteriota bacterium]MDA1246591.1 precorrin-6y C5,15-methyltransferase (decarboxylating) subunit CbiE [Cyanobacteriota bacterium]
MLEIVGTDAGGVAALPDRSLALVRAAQLLLAPQRLLAELGPWWQAEQAAGRIPVERSCPALLASDRSEQIFGPLQQALASGEPAVLLASGDPLWFGIGRLLLQHFPAAQLRFHPAPCSLQLAFARLCRPWQDASWISLHGRDPEPLAAALQKRPSALAVLTDPSRGGAEEVRRILAASGLEAAYAFWLCERLGHSAERVQRLEPGAPLPLDCDPLHLVLLIAESPAGAADPATLPLFGLDDGLFLQHDDRPGLMTKREVRIQLLADLELPELGVLWDIGAGVGSVGLEALRLRPGLKLWAIEVRGGSAALIAANAERLGVRPAGLREAKAPEALAELPDPDRVLLGGSGRERVAVLTAVLQRLRPGGVVVIPLATVEALAELRPLLEQAGCAVKVAQHQAWRGAPLAEGTRLAPLNPVLVLKGRLP